MAERSFILDMDVGIDDALAIIVLAGTADVEIAAVGSVHGNVRAELAALWSIGETPEHPWRAVPKASARPQP